jgi:hypothetical protein
MAENGIEHLRVLIANEREDRLALLAEVVSGLGHEVIAGSIEVEEVGPATAREHPDVAGAIVESHLLLLPAAPQAP